MKQLLIYMLSALLLSACSLNPTLVEQPSTLQVEVTKDVFIALPSPAQLQQDLNVSQLISAQWGDEMQQKLLMQLQVDQQQVVLAGFSTWGARLLSLTYRDNNIQTYVMNGLADTLPKPEQVLFNVMLSIWPIDAWQPILQPIGWQLLETDLQRELINQQGEVVVVINYEKMPYLSGVITFKHLMLNYKITIETNSESS